MTHRVLHNAARLSVQKRRAVYVIAFGNAWRLRLALPPKAKLLAIVSGPEVTRWSSAR